MISKKRHIKIFGLILFSVSIVWSSQVQLITSHQKSNGTLLRIVTSSVMDLDNIAGWVGQENWFYVTLNGTYLSPSAVEYIELHLQSPENFPHQLWLLIVRLVELREQG